MVRNEHYDTKQKSQIFDVIKKQKGEFTIREIYQKTKKIAGLTTVYRLVDRLVEEGRVSKNIGKDNTTYYQYLEKCDKENHFYLKCDNCGDMMHVDCECMEEMTSHVLKKHNFKLSEKRMIINGICEKCSREI